MYNSSVQVGVVGELGVVSVVGVVGELGVVSVVGVVGELGVVSVVGVVEGVHGNNVFLRAFRFTAN